MGVTFFDTAEMYGWGTGSNEILVGKAVRDFRDDVVLATKFGVDMSVPPEQIGGPLNSRPDNIRNVDPRWQPGNFEKNIEAVDRLAALAAAKGATVSQLALAWLLTRGEHIVPIPGTRSPKRIQENAGAADLTLTDTDLKTIDEILPHGERRPKPLELASGTLFDGAEHAAGRRRGGLRETRPGHCDSPSSSPPRPGARHGSHAAGRGWPVTFTPPADGRPAAVRGAGAAAGDEVRPLRACPLGDLNLPRRPARAAGRRTGPAVWRPPPAG